MNCYNHDSASAVGVCKHCGKAICHNCCTDTGAGLACSSTCVSEIESINNLVRRNLASHASHQRNAYFMPAFFGFMGLLFVVFGLQRDGVFGMSTIMGAGFLIFAAIYASIVAKWLRNNHDA